MEFKVYLTIDIDVTSYEEYEQYPAAICTLNNALDRFESMRLL